MFIFKLAKYILLALLLLPSLSFAQTVISGIVRNADMQPIAGVSLKLKPDKAGSLTDSLGRYKFKTNIKGQTYIIASAIGYRTDSILININGQLFFSSLILKESNTQLTGVKINVRRNLSQVNYDYTQTPLTIAMTAGAAADVTAALQTFAGAAPAGNETGFFVHGGSASETAVVFDGLLVKNAFGSRLPDLANRSRFSAFIFDKTSFTATGFNASYGQALSSILSMDTKGIANKSSTELTLVNLGFGIARTQKFRNSSLTVGANHYNFALNNYLIPQFTLWQKHPMQNQTSLNYKLKTSKTGLIKVFIDYSDTDLSFNIKNPITASEDLLSNRNKNLYFNSNFQEYLNRDWKIYAGIGFNRTLESGLVNSNNYYQNDNIWQEKVMLTRALSGGSSIQFGVEQFQSKRAEGYAGLSRAYTDVLSAGFAETEFYINNQLNLQTGLRSEYSAYLKKSNISPRIALKYLPSPKQQLTASYGIYLQKPDDSFLTETATLAYEKNEQFTIDYEHKFSYRVLRLTAYYKDYQNLVKITTPVFSGFQAYGPPIKVLNFSQNGSGYAKGIDVFYKDKNSLRLIEFYTSYSYIDTKRNYIDYPDFGRPNFAPEHTFNFVLQKATAKVNWLYSLAYTYSTGRSYFNPNNPVFMGNNTKDFHNLSLSATYLPKWIKGLSAFNLNINNILGFNNIYGYRYSYDGSRRETILPPSKRSVLLSFKINLDGDDFNH